MSTRVAIVGASGYGGQELLRLLASHPEFEVAAVMSQRLVGRAVADVHPHLAGFYDGLEFTSADALPPNCDAVFLAVPHGAAAPIAKTLGTRRIVDLSRDFRVDDTWVYGLTESNRGALLDAHGVANPGCFATGALLAVLPLAEQGLLRGDLTLAQTEAGASSGGYMKRGPTREYASEEAHYRDLIAVWKRSIELMHGTALAAGAASFHFLQPNQRVPGSKVFAPGEREVALPRRQAYDVPARKGYPGLIAAGKRMRAAGLPFDDLTMVFEDVSETVYSDGCCHVNQLGSRLLALEIARIIRDRFAAGEACPSFR